MSLRIKPILVLVVLGLLIILWRAAPAEAQADTPESPQVIQTLPVELYSMTATPGLDGGIRHTVLEGQFLYTIAELYAIPIDVLLANNNLTLESVIQPGDILIITAGGEINLGEPTATPEGSFDPTLLDVIPSPTLLPTESATVTPEPTPTESLGFVERLFSSNTGWLAVGVMGLVILGVVLLVISSRRIQ